MEYVGIDLHQKYSQVCVLNEDGEIVEEASIPTTRSSLTRWFGGREEMRIVVEAGSSTPWVCRLLREMGQEVAVVNPHRVRLIAESTMKCDRVDAEVLARLSRFDGGLLPTVHQRSESAQLGRTCQRARTALSKARVQMINSVRGSARSWGYRLRGCSTERFVAMWGETELPEQIREALDSLVETIAEITQRLTLLDKQLRKHVRDDELLRRFTEVPGIGPVVATAFVSWIDDPTRFAKSRSVGAYLGTRVKLRDSGEKKKRGPITRAGDPQMRWLLVQAAHACLRTRQDSELKQWAEQLEARSCRNIAAVGLARKLAVLLHRLWVTGDTYRRFPQCA